MMDIRPVDFGRGPVAFIDRALLDRWMGAEDDRYREACNALMASSDIAVALSFEGGMRALFMTNEGGQHFVLSRNGEFIVFELYQDEDLDSLKFGESGGVIEFHADECMCVSAAETAGGAGGGAPPFAVSAAICMVVTRNGIRVGHGLLFK